MNGEPSTTVTVRVPIALRDKIKVLAAEDRRSMNQYIVILMEEAVAASEGSKGGGK